MILERTQSESLLLVGIAGGFPEQGVHRGDVIIAHTVHSFDYGKLTKGTFKRRPELDFNCDRGLLSQADQIVADKHQAWRRRIRGSRPDQKDRSKSIAHSDCYVASSNKVVDDPDHAFFSAVAATFPEIHAVEMEAVGAGASARLVQSERTLRILMIRGISDEPGALSGGKSQRSKWKTYAASVAAAFARKLVEGLATGKPNGGPGRLHRPRPGSVFQTGGTLPPGSKSYVRRDCDGRVAAAVLAGHSLIAVSGEYGIGKSSLLVRLREQVRDTDGELYMVDCQGMSTHSPEAFISEVLTVVKLEIGEADSWQTLAERSGGTSRVALAIDDFGTLTKAVVHAVVPHLCWLAERGVNIIICAQDPIKHLRLTGINPKYARGWHNIEVVPFKKVDEVQQLLSLLPVPVRAQTWPLASKILKLSEGRPRTLQVLCRKLSSISTIVTAVKLRTTVSRLVDDPRSYTL
jgi:nucleoside phosphorylase